MRCPLSLLLLKTLTGQVASLLSHQPPNKTQLHNKDTGAHPDVHRLCYSSSKDWQGPLEGYWRHAKPAEITHSLSTTPGNLLPMLAGIVPKEHADEWDKTACPLEIAHFSCFYMGSNARANRSLHRHYQPYKCDLPLIDIKTVLKKLQNRTLHIMGDSIMMQLFVAFVCESREYISNMDVEWHGKGGSLVCPFADSRHCYLQANSISPVGGAVQLSFNYTTGQMHAKISPESRASMSLSRSGTSVDPSLLVREERDESLDDVNLEALAVNKICIHMDQGGVDAHVCSVPTPFPGGETLVTMEQSVQLILDASPQDVIVYNMGNHFHLEDYEEYKAGLEQIARAASQWGGLFIWRESTPEHFATPDGSWINTTENKFKDCQALNTSDPGVMRNNSWRNTLANPLMREVANASILYTYQTAATQWQAHVGDTPVSFGLVVKDCQHFCMPGVPNLWSDMLGAMLVNAL